MGKNARGDHKSKAKDSPSKTVRTMKQVMRDKDNRAHVEQAIRDQQSRPGKN